MANVKVDREYNSFVRGLITEANILSFPDNASVDEDNMVLNIDGSRQRRLGMDYENNFSLIDTLVPNNILNESTPSVHKWVGAGNNPRTVLGIIHIYDRLYFVDLTSSNPSSTLKNNGNYVPISPTTKLISTASINGYLVCVNEDQEPFYLQYTESTDVVTKTTINIKIRDFWGIEDNLEIASRPSSLTNAHNYNIRNQGWRPDYAWLLYLTFLFYPSNADIMYLGKNSTGVFEPIVFVQQEFGTSAAPKGKFIIDYNNRGTSRTILTSNSDLPLDREQGKPSCVTSYSGRVFYSGINSSVIDGDKRSPNYSGIVFFSRVSASASDLGKCYSDADPTSEHISDLVDTDGGYIIIPDATGIKALIPVGGSIAVMASNGIWEISGGGTIFSATNYQVRKVSSVGVSSVLSIVQAEDSVVYWSDGGIYALTADSVSGNLISTNITQDTIQTFYNNISSLGKMYSQGIYDSSNKKLRWLYNDTTGYPTDRKIKYNRELIFDLRLKAFYPNTISTGDTSAPYIAGYVITPNYISTTTEVNIVSNADMVVVDDVQVVVSEAINSDSQSFTKYFIINPNPGSTDQITFGVFRNIDFVDWYNHDGIGKDYTSYLITGYDGSVPTKAGYAQDTQRIKSVDTVTFHFKRTEDGFTSDGFDIVPTNQSSCKVQSQWEWTDSPNAGRWGTEFQAYRYKLNYVPSSVYDPFDYSYQVITTKNKLRGSGRVLSLYLHSESGKDMHILGWGVESSIRARI